MKRLVMPVILTILTVVLTFTHSVAVNTSQRLLSSAVLLEIDGGFDLSAETLAKQPYDFSVYFQKNGRVEHALSKNTTQIREIWTDSRYADYSGIRMLSGSFFPGESAREAVIGSAMALSLFLTDDVVGRQIDIDGTVYSICGVYADEPSMFARLAMHPYPQVYLPYERIDGNQAFTMLIPVQNSSMEAQARDTAGTVLGGYIYTAETVNMAEARDLAEQSRRLVLFVFGAALALMLVIIAGKRIRIFVLAMSAQQRQYLGFGSSEVRRHTPYLIVCFSMIAAGVGIFLLAMFPVILPQAMLGANGLEPQGWIDNLLNYTRNLHMEYRGFHERYAYYTLFFLYGQSLLITAAFFAALNSWIKYFSQAGIAGKIFKMKEHKN